MRQGLDDFEIVIVDNASQDDTEALVGGVVMSLCLAKMSSGRNEE
jgi:hypothetical protein